MFIGFVTPFFFCEGSKTSDILLYVRPENRGTRAALCLVKKYQEWAAEQDNVLCIETGVSTGCGKADEFYKKMGYNQIGTIYRLDEERSDVRRR